MVQNFDTSKIDGRNTTISLVFCKKSTCPTGQELSKRSEIAQNVSATLQEHDFTNIKLITTSADTPCELMRAFYQKGNPNNELINHAISQTIKSSGGSVVSKGKTGLFYLVEI